LILLPPGSFWHAVCLHVACCCDLLGIIHWCVAPAPSLLHCAGVSRCPAH
jgi:hypothetical protein